MNATATVSLRNDIADLPRLSNFIAEFCEQNGLPQKMEMLLNLAAEEAFVNVVMHGYEDSAPHQILLGIGMEEAIVELTLEDDARAFNPLEVPEFDPATPIEQRNNGGLGIHLLRNLMTELQYERAAGKNRLTMRKVLG